MYMYVYIESVALQMYIVHAYNLEKSPKCGSVYMYMYMYMYM